MKLASTIFFLFLCPLLTIMHGQESSTSDITTDPLPSSHPPSTQSVGSPAGNPLDSQKQEKTDAAQVKSYAVMPNYYQPQPAPAAIPVPLPINIQAGPLMLPPGMKQAPYPPMQPLYPQPMYPQAGHKSDTLQPPLLVKMPAEGNPQYAAFITEAHGNAEAAAAMINSDLSNHKSSLDIDLTLDSNPSSTNLIGSGFNSLPPNDHWPQPTAEMPKIVGLDVKCEKNLMKVSIEFDRPFNGIIFSKGHYRSANCLHLPPGLGRQSATFDVPVNGCGVQGNSLTGLYGRDASSGGSYFENTIVVQYDPQVQEVWDQARRLRCSWHDQYEKSVTFRPFAVDMLEIVRADFAGDNVGCWMQIQSGKGPWASEVSGIVKIGQDMTMVLAIQDNENKFDMLVRNCMAHDGKRAPIQLVDNQGCVVRPKVMTSFTKIKNFDSSASVLSYAYFRAFKFPDSMEVYFQCTIQICRHQCPEQCSQPADNDFLGDLNLVAAQHSFVAGRPRDERDVNDQTEEDAEVGVKKVIQVVSTGDFAFALENSTSTPIVYPALEDESGYVCMSTPGFAATLILLLSLLIIAALLCTFLCIRQHMFANGGSENNSYFDPLPSFIKIKKTIR